MGISFIQALLCGFVYYMAQSIWLMGLNYYVIMRPLVMGLCVGLVMGDVSKGVEVGIQIQLIYMGFIGAGGAPPADMGLAGSCGTALAIAQDLSSSAALAIAVPIGVLGLFLNTGKMTWNSFFTGPCEKAGRAGNLKGVFFWNVVVPQSIEAVIRIGVVTAFLLGSNAATDLLDRIMTPAVTNIFNVIAQLLPCLGLALNLRAIAKKETWPFFFLGFLLMGYLDVTIIFITGVAAIIGYCLTFGKDKISPSSEPAETD